MANLIECPTCHNQVSENARVCPHCGEPIAAWVQQEINNEIRCPGKEVTGLVLGIVALIWSLCGLVFACIPLAGIAYAIPFAVIAIGCGIAALILHNKVQKQATLITNKIESGRTLGFCGVIIGVASIIIAIIVSVVYIKKTTPPQTEEYIQNILNVMEQELLEGP